MMQLPQRLRLATRELDVPAYLLPLLALQGSWVRQRIPFVPEAGPPFRGSGLSLHLPAIPPLHLIVLGESTAAGVGASSHRHSIAGQCASALACIAGRNVAWTVRGRSGATVADIRRWLLPAILDECGGSFDIALVVVGVNDVLRLTPQGRWQTELTSLIGDLSAVSPHAKVVLAGLPPLDRFPSLPRPLRGVLAARARRLDQAASDAANLARNCIHSPTPPADPNHFSADHFHPGEKGYAGWGRTLAAGIVTAWPMLQAGCVIAKR